MKRLLLLSILCTFVLVGFVYAELDLSDYPSPFIVGNTFNGILVIGDTAPAESVISVSDISSSLQFKVGDDGTVIRISVGPTKLASEVLDYKAQNIISVGSPCENSVTAKIMGNPADCHQGFELNKGAIQLFDTGNENIALVVAGYNPADTRNAAAVLANYADYKSSLKGAKVIVKKVNNQLTVTEASSSSASGGGGGGGGAGTTNQCSYPEKVDCNTKEEADLVLNEWTQGKCSKEASLKCIEIWTKSQPQCPQELKCDGNYKYYQNSDCSVSNKEYCSYGCENGVCKPYERKECVNGVAYWYKGNSLYETSENCFVQGKICVEGQCVIDPQCIEHMRTDCYDNDVYWFGDCGNGISDKYMECGEAGCSNGKCTTTTCTPSWNCDSWSSCTNGKQTRTCTDINNCETYSGMPATSQICAVNYNFNDYPLILIHGLWSDASSMGELKSKLTSYYEDKGDYYGELNCDDIKTSKKPIVISYGYNPKADSKNALDDLGDDFSKFAQQVKYCTGAPKVDIVAHSLGGLVSRWAIKFYGAKVDKLVMLGTPNHWFRLSMNPNEMKKRAPVELQLLLNADDIYGMLNTAPEACCNVNYYVIRGNANTYSIDNSPNDGLVTTASAYLNGADTWDVGCSHTDDWGNDKSMIKPSKCPEAYNHILEAIGKSTTSPTENTVKDKIETPTTQPISTGTKYCYKRFLGFLWCMEYRYG